MEETKQLDIQFGLPFDENNEEQQRTRAEKIVTAAITDGVDAYYEIKKSKHATVVEVKEWEEHTTFMINFPNATDDQLSRYFELLGREK